MREGVNLQGEQWEITRKDGERRVVAISTSCVDHFPGETRVVAFFRDVTDRRRADDELRAREQRFRVFVDHAADAFFLHEPGGVVCDVNHQACVRLGYERDELIGRSPLDFDTEMTPTGLAQLVSKLQSGDTVVFDSRHRRKDGSTFPVEVRLRQFTIGGRQLALSIIHDLTSRNRTLDALRASEQRFRELGDAIPQIVWTAGPDGGLAFLNAKVAEYSGVSADALKGWSWGAILHADDLPRAVAVWNQILTSGVPEDVEFRIRRADGEYRWHVTRQSPARDATGAVTGWYGTCTDIEDRKRAEDALHRSVSLLQATLDSTAEDILVVDLEGRIIDLNRQFVALWNLPTEFAAVGRKEDLVAAFRDEGAMSAVFGKLADPAGFAARVAEIYLIPDRPSYDVVEFRDGTILERYSHPQWIDGKPVGRVWSFRDVTERTRAEQALARRQGVLERIAGGAGMAEVLARIVELVEDEIDDSICSILLVDADGRLRIGAAQNLPAEYNAAIDGVAVGPAAGSCGTAAHLGRPVVVADIATDLLWADYRGAALPHGFRACWAVPVLAAETTENTLLGTFAVYRRRASEPTSDEMGIFTHPPTSRESRSRGSGRGRRFASG